MPALILISFFSSFHIFAAKYLHDLRPYLVVFTFGIERIKSCRRSYLVLVSVKNSVIKREMDNGKARCVEVHDVW